MICVRHSIVCKHQPNLGKKNTVIHKLRKRQTVLEKESSRILEKMDNKMDKYELKKLSMELTSVCKSILEIQETINHIDTYVLFYKDIESELEL